MTVITTNIHYLILNRLSADHIICLAKSNLEWFNTLRCKGSKWWKRLFMLCNRSTGRHVYIYGYTQNSKMLKFYYHLSFKQNKQSAPCWKCMGLAADFGFLEVVKCVMNQKELSTVNYNYNYDYNINFHNTLYWALYKLHFSIIRYLVEWYDYHYNKAVKANAANNPWVQEVSALTHKANQLIINGIGKLTIIRYWVETIKKQEHRIPDECYEILLDAAKSNKLDVIRYLTESVGQPIDDNLLNEMCVHACRNGNLSILRYLVKRLGLTSNHARGDNNAAFYVAALTGHLHIIRYLVERVGLTSPDACEQNNHALRGACCYDYVHVVRYLVERLGLTAEDVGDITYVLRRGGHNVVVYLVQRLRINLTK